MRRPARLERAGALTPRDRIWSAIRSFQGEPWSVVEVMLLSEQQAATVLNYIEGLLKGGYIVRDGDFGTTARGRMRRELRRFVLARDVGAHAPRVTGDGKPVEQGAGREAMWNIIRRSREDFSWRDLAYRASTRKHPVAAEEAHTYIRYLKKAGYLATSVAAKPGRKAGTPERVRFVRARDTGPRAPLISREKQVMDGNTGLIVFDPFEQLERTLLQGGKHDQ